MYLNGESLMKMSKCVLAGLVLNYKEMFHSTFSATNDELKELKADNCKLESDLAINRKFNHKHTQQLIKVERNVGQTNSILVNNDLKYQKSLSLFRMMTWKAVC